MVCISLQSKLMTKRGDDSVNGALRRAATKAALGFSAGAAGSVANTIFVILLGATGVIAAAGITAKVQMSPAWIYPRI